MCKYIFNKERGDLLLELNKIHLGDCHKLIKQIPDKSIDLVYIDIPYLYSSNFGERLVNSNKIKENDIKNISNGIDYSIFEELCRVMKNIYIYIWCSEEQIIELMNLFVNEKKCDYKILGWCKTNPMPMYSYRFMNDVEYCLLFKDKKAKMSGNDTFENSFRFYKAPININDKKTYRHPTIKPLQCVKNHIEKSTKEQDIILDCYCGSGTTCVAAKELKRQFIGIEIDKEYWKIANDRIKGIDASGQTSIFTFL